MDSRQKFDILNGENPLREKEPFEIGVDIGGTLAKIAIVVNNSREDILQALEGDTEIAEEMQGKDYNVFLTRCDTKDYLQKMNHLLSKLKKFKKFETIQATGGGAYRLETPILKRFNISLNKHDELLSLVYGYIFMNTFSPFYRINSDNMIQPVDSFSLVYPHVAVNIGSGVSILRVNSFKDVSRLDGTGMGGETLVGLAKLLLNEDNFENILKLAENGENKMIDLTSNELYGNTAPTESVGSWFGKGVWCLHERQSYKKEDIAKSLLLMICSNIAKLTVEYAGLNGIKQILFFGNFTVKGSYAVTTLNDCMKALGKDYDVLFNTYEGYLGSIGSILQNRDKTN